MPDGIFSISDKENTHDGAKLILDDQTSAPTFTSLKKQWVMATIQRNPTKEEDSQFDPIRTLCLFIQSASVHNDAS